MPDTRDAFARARGQSHHPRALVAPPSAQKRHLDAERLERALPTAPIVDGGAVRDPQSAHRTSH